MNEDRGVEINDVAPTSLSHIIGQRACVDQLRVAIDAAFEDGRKMDSCLMVGGPGLGKSALARVISNEMATDFHEVIGQSITSPADLNAFLLTAKEKSVCHIDECHELRKDFQTALYLALDQRKLFMGGGKSIQSLPISDFTLLLSTTDEYCLLKEIAQAGPLMRDYQSLIKSMTPKLEKLNGEIRSRASRYTTMKEQVNSCLENAEEMDVRRANRFNVLSARLKSVLREDIRVRESEKKK